jgi:DNA-binding response OmpR family regulator
MRVLLVEDDLPLADVTARGLRRDGFAVDVAPDGEDAVDRLAVVDYDLVVLDRGLPGLSGDALCEQLAAEGATARILMLSAASELDQRVEGLSLGADDYLSKPFAMTELVARLRALGRRVHRATPPTLHWADVCLDPGRRTATRGRRSLPLANREFAVLEMLMLAEGTVVSAETLIERVWDDGLDPFSSVVRVTMCSLRRKLGDPPLISTVAGSGYRLS